MKLFWRGFDKVVDAMVGLAAALLVFVTVSVCYGVATRFFFKSPSIWVAQATEYGLLWMVMLSTTWLLRARGHVAVDIVHSHLGEGTKKVLDFAMFILGGVACAVIFVFSLSYACDCILGDVTDVRAITVPKSAVYSIIPVAFFLLTLQFLRMAWERMTGAEAGR